ncbi:CoA pyrophosphatase [Nocardia sp. NPDC050717]|uniref:NUDIX hydrolase n=1 Tax=Nocardia sp. NPDC050717 TaxID=3157221 RepID=UPI00340568BE
MSNPHLPRSIAEFRALAEARLAAFPRIAVPDAPGTRRAGVTLCVVPGAEDGLAVLVMKRAYRGRNAGQWGLPGGRLEPGETAESAALRELHEELNLTAKPADVLGLLDDFPATSGFAITPIVVTVDDVDALRPNPDEVFTVHHVDLARLAAEDVPHWVRPEDATLQHELRGDLPEADVGGLLQMRLGPGMTIHAPTGALLWQFRAVVLLGRSPAESRVAHFTQPDWTRH